MEKEIKEKRANKGYKVANSHYLKAMERAAAEKATLAGMIEMLVINYANGLQVHYFPREVEASKPKAAVQPKRKRKAKELSA